MTNVINVLKCLIQANVTLVVVIIMCDSFIKIVDDDFSYFSFQYLVFKKSSGCHSWSLVFLCPGS